MIIFGLIGIIFIFWFALEGLWKLIPWLVLLVIITSTLGFIIDHFVFFIIAVISLTVMYVIGKKG
ncbi:hypothetical protein EFE10_05140 [Leuconostoc citreum]|nr:hypothetical protein [Leuconostoc citreum]MCS8599760.1 hypothetical protein [Leuconostoc citreum]